MRSWVLAATLVAFAAGVMPAKADPPSWAPAHGWRHHHHHDGDDDDDAPRHHDGDDDEDYAPPPPHHHVVRVMVADDEIYRGSDGRYYCRRSDGTMGLVVGAAVGAVIGNRLAPRHSATLGTLLGAGAGAVIGQSLDEGSPHCE
jgi:hypothetical protein